MSDDRLWAFLRKAAESHKESFLPQMQELFGVEDASIVGAVFRPAVAEDFEPDTDADTDWVLEVYYRADTSLFGKAGLSSKLTFVLGVDTQEEAMAEVLKADTTGGGE